LSLFSGRIRVWKRRVNTVVSEFSNKQLPNPLAGVGLTSIASVLFTCIAWMPKHRVDTNLQRA
jgi:hypothetical protein